MRNLLINLGLKKIEHYEFNENLKRMNDELANMILEKRDLDDETYNKAMCEIKIFFWGISIPLFVEKLPQYLRAETFSFYESDIIYSSIDETQYSEDFLQELMFDRLEYNENGLKEIGNLSTGTNFFEQIKILWFEKPLSEVNDIMDQNMMDFDVIKKAKNQTEMQLLYVHFAPAWLKELEGLIKITKK